MMFADFMFDIFEQKNRSDALIWKDRSFSYEWLHTRVRKWLEIIAGEKIQANDVVALEADFSPESVALFLALLDSGCTLVPLTTSVEAKKPRFKEIAEVQRSISLDDQDRAQFDRYDRKPENELYLELRKRGHPGLVLFTSGSTGESKAAIHDMVQILNKFHVARHCFRTIPFLLYDHIGGVNTLLYTLSNGGCLVTLEDRDPDKVLSAVEKYGVELLPTSPTFINLILLSEAYRRYDLSSLKVVTYGTEPMPESTLRRLHELFPEVRLQQTYGLTEMGILRSKSRSSESLWVKVGGEDYQTRVIDGHLQIKAKSAMLGYLNAPSPFSEDGWFDTGDLVEVDGEYVRFLGRESEIINVGGEKVYPAEVEGILQEMDNVQEATVVGEEHPITGNIVVANVLLGHEEERREFTKRLKQYCKDRIPNYMIPVKIKIVNEKQHGDRFKKIRREL